jgi:chromosome segregation ATPase
MSETTSIEVLRAELAEKEEKLRKLVRHLDQIARTEFRDRAQRLKQMRAEREELENELDALRAKIKQME